MSREQKPLTLGRVDEIAAKLEAAPKLDTKHQRVNNQEAVALLKKHIRDLLDNRGYTFDLVAELLSKEGVELSGPALRSYLSRADPRHRAKPESTAKKTRGAKAVASSETSPDTRNATRSAPPQGSLATRGGGTFQVREDTRDL